MGYSMIEMVDNRLNHYFEDRSLYEYSPFTVENLRDSIILEIIKRAYHESRERKSLRANRGSDDDDLRMRDSRWLSYAQHYRTLQYEDVKQRFDISIPELLPQDVNTIKGKLEGHKITEMQYFEINTMADFPILKAIISKRICEVKKVSNDEFIHGMEEYDQLVSYLIDLIDGDDEDVIFGTIALFTLEWKYNIEFYYNCAVEAEKQGVKDVPAHRLSLLCASLTTPMPPDFKRELHTESRFVLHRLDLVEYLYSVSDDDWEEVEEKFFEYFAARYYIESENVHKWSMPEFFITHIPRSQWADFFRKHYDIRKIYRQKEWTNKRIRYVRKIIDALVRNQPVPKL